jgi:putative phosphoribosyl transferase
VRAATLLIVGGADLPVLEMNRRALEQMRCIKELSIVSGATHLFEEPGALESVAALASRWFRQHLAAAAQGAA